MHYRAKLGLTGVAAALVLAAAAVGASAGNLSVSEREFRIRWTSFKYAGPPGNIGCALSLLGNFHSNTMTKTRGALIGVVTSAEIGACDPGTAVTVLTATLPWHFTYESFRGNLPAITRIRSLLVGAAFRVQSRDGVACLFRTDATEPARGDIEVNPITGKVINLTADPSSEIDLGGGFFCEIAGDTSVEGVASVSTPSERLVFFRLI